MEGFPGGYPRLAAFTDSHDNFMLYRRFGYLSSRVLLDKQDELRELEDKLEELDVSDTWDFPDKLQKRDLQGEERQRLLTQIQTKFVDYGQFDEAQIFNCPLANRAKLLCFQRHSN